ncbi:MAG: hypothetical protein IJ336_07295 [Lachnospiraceae bacterium]|nr:hypothetical protein [Lachnospiraceae bacterium]
MKRKAYKFLIITAAMTLGLVGCSTEAKVERQLELGASSMEAGDYDAAITAYEEAIALDKYEIEGYEGLVVAMVSDGRSNEEIAGVVAGVTDAITELKASEEGLSEEDKAAAERFYTLASDAIAGDMDMEIAIMEEGVGVLGEESQIADAYEDKVNEVIDHYLAGNNLEEAKELAGQMATTLPSNENAQDTAATVTEKAEAEQDLVDILMTAYEYIQNEDWAALAEFSDSEELAIIKEKVGDAGNYSYIFGGGTTGVGIGYYSMEGCSCDMWYAGDYVDGMRSGYGGWYQTFIGEEGLYLDAYTGDWVNDIPQGEGHEYTIKDGEVIEDFDVQVTDGKISGTFDFTFNMKDGTVYVRQFEMFEGRYVEIDVPDWVAEAVTEGKYPYCIAYYTSEDGYESAIWAEASYDEKLRTVSHFRK